MRMELKGKRALVTGASSGIGREAAKALAAAGVRVAITARRTEALESLAAEIGRASPEAGRPVVLAADLSRPGAGEDLARRAIDALGGVDILVNNAGVGIGGLQWIVGDSPAAREMMETNFWAPLALTRALVPGMRERRTGAVVNVASLAADVPFTMMGHYAATKAAISIASETLRAELRGTGVGVLLVLPGPVDTAMLAEAGEVPSASRFIRRLPRGNAPVLARRIVRALAGGRRVLVYPRSLGLAHLFPTLMRRISFWMMRGGTDANDERVVRGGSTGDDVARAARDKHEGAAASGRDATS